MPDNEEFDFDRLLDEVEAETDAKLASRISSLTRMKDEEIKQLFPKKADKKKLIELISIVKSSTSMNEKRNKLIGNIGKFADTVITVLKKLV